MFDEMPVPNIVSYNSLISGLTRYGYYNESLRFLRKMQKEYDYVFMDEFTLVSVVGTCACLGALELLRQVHGVGLVIGLRFNIVVYNALIDAYGKCGKIDSSYLIFSRMPEKDVVSWTSMVVAYAQASRLVEACWVFNQMPVKNTVTWTALIAGYAQNGRGYEALDIFEQMLEEGIALSDFTYVSVLSACADLALSHRGKQLHGRIVRNSSMSGTCNNVFLSNALLDMYCKCGDMKSAIKLFERIHGRDIITWNTVITGYAQNGHGDKSLSLFNKMIKTNLKPNHVTFLGVLSGCSHTGLVCEGLRILEMMEKDFGVVPRLDHYSVLIDLLGRKNRLKEALHLIVKAPSGSDHVGMWGALLGACRVHGNLDLARTAAEALFKLEPENTGRYVMLYNVYAAAGRWDDASQVRSLMDERGLGKEAAYSWIDVKNTRHEFVAKGKSHCKAEQIYESLDKLVDHMRDPGYLAHNADTFIPEVDGVS